MIAIVISRDGEPTRRKVFALGRDVTVGSGEDNDLVLADGSVAVHHARISIARPGFAGPRSAPEGSAESIDRVVTIGPVGADRVVVDGKRVKAPKPWKTGVASIGAFTLRLVKPAALPVADARDPIERELLAAIADRDEASRLVYADWLEHRGEVVRAEFMRVQHRLGDLAADDPAFEPATDRLRELAAHVDQDWRARVARPSIEGCDGFDFQCPKEWGSLATTDRSDVRFCGTCKQDVFYSSSIGVAREHAARGECVALDIGAARWNHDLASPFGVYVCPSCGLDVGLGARRCPACATEVRAPMLRGRMVVTRTDVFDDDP